MSFIVNNNTDRSIIIILICIIILVIFHYLLFTDSKKIYNNLEGFEYTDKDRYLNNLLLNTEQEYNFKKYNSINSEAEQEDVSILSSQYSLLPQSSSVRIPLSTDIINKIINETYPKISEDNSKLSILKNIMNIQPSGGREVLIKSNSDVDNFMVDSIFKLKVNIPGMPTFNRGEDYDKNKYKYPNNFYLAVEKLIPNCVISLLNNCYPIYIDDPKKCSIKKTTTGLSDNNYRLILISEETLLNPDHDIGKNTNFTLMKLGDKYYLKNIETGYMPALFKNNETFNREFQQKRYLFQGGSCFPLSPCQAKEGEKNSKK